jgi:hypothetical protein
MQTSQLTELPKDEPQLAVLGLDALQSFANRPTLVIEQTTMVSSIQRKD